MKNPTVRNDWVQYTPFIYPIEGKKNLSQSFSSHRNVNFFDIFLNRRTNKNLVECSLDKLSELLFFCIKPQVISLDDSGTIVSKRTYPSAGARHPIDLLISLPNKIKDRTISYYNPIEHNLNQLLVEKGKLLSFFFDVDKTLKLNNAILIWFSIQTGKTSSKYNNPESLYWKDAGALLYCIQLMCEYLDIGSCPIGYLANDTFNDLFNTDRLISGGGILIGRKM